MRIAMIGQKRIPTREGGIEVHVEEISKRLAAMGHTVDAYCRNSDKALTQYEGINIISVPTIDSKSLDAIVYSFIATCMALFKPYDIYHFHALGPSVMSFLPRMLGKKVVTTVHGLDWQRAKWGKFAKAYLKLGEYCSAKLAHKTIVLSKNVGEYYFNKYKKKTEYIKNGINPYNTAPADEITKQYGLINGSYILFLARIVPEKGLHYLIEAYNGLKTDKKLVIAGDSSHSDDYLEGIRAMAKQNPNILMTGFVQGKLLEELYSNAYIYVLPSDIEGMPISLLEAFAYGNCCLTSDISENAEVVMDKGVVFKAGSVDDLQKKLSYLLNNNMLVMQYKLDAANHIHKLCSWNDTVNSLDNLYKSCY